MDNFNGPVGIMLPISVGFSRILLGKSTSRMNFVPVDYVTNSLVSIIAQSAPHLEKNKQAGIVPPEVPVYNYGLSKAKAIPIWNIISTGMKFAEMYPVANLMWYPSVFITNNLFVYTLFFYFAQILPAIFIDFILKLAGQKLSILRLLRKIYYVQVSLLYFMRHQFDFVNYNTMHSQKLLSFADSKKFRCDSDIYFDSYMGVSLLGARKYLLGQDPKTIPRARIVYRIFQGIYYMIVAALCYFVYVRCFHPLAAPATV